MYQHIFEELEDRFDDAYRTYDMPPTPGDDDAPPEYGTEPYYDEPDVSEPVPEPSYEPDAPAHIASGYGSCYPADEPTEDDYRREQQLAEQIEYPKEPLQTVTCAELSDCVFERREAIINGFLTAGLTVLAGSPKVGKSWLMLNMCIQVAKGEPFLGMPTKKCGVLYIALEDDMRRLQRRMYTVTDECPDNCYITTRCSRISEEFEKELCLFFVEHKDVRLIVIDTLQMIRCKGRDLSYANDYDEMSTVKNIADTLGIAVVLVHHTRKMSDADCMNEISGTNGIAGSADTLMVLKKEKRTSGSATLSCTGRDIEDRELDLTLDRDSCTWKVRSDSASPEPEKLPDELNDLVAFMKKQGSFDGTNSDFAALFTQDTGWVITASSLKRSMNRCRYELQDMGVSFESYVRNNKRCISIRFDTDKYAKIR